MAKGYKVGKTIWKFVKTTGVLGAGAVAGATFPTEGADATQWIIFALSVAPPAISAINNIRKNFNNAVEEVRSEDVMSIYGGLLLFMLGLGLIFLSSGSSIYIALTG